MPDLHPLFVHFPIALLTLFAGLELLRFKAITSRLELFYTKAILVITGTIGGFIAAQAGEIAEETYKGGQSLNLLETHSSIAEATNILAIIIAALYVGAWIKRSGKQLPMPQIFALCEKITSSWIMIPAALVLLTAISVTGALGGALVYGPDADPVVSFVYKLLVR